MSGRGESETPSPTVEAIKKRAYVVALSIATVASLTEFTLLGDVGASVFRWLLGLGLCVLAALFLLSFGAKRLRTTLVERIVVGISWVFIIAREYTGLAALTGEGFERGVVPNLGIWMHAGFIFTFVVLPTRAALRAAIACFVVLISGGVAFCIARGSALAVYEINTLFQYLVVSNGFTIAFVHYLSRTKEELARERTERILMSRLAHTDDLTHLPNRRAILQSLQRAVDRSDREGSNLSVIMFDIDRFKRVNDSYGHATGDAILRRAATITIDTLRTSDEIGRFGGEEFLIVAFGADEAAAAGLADRLRHAFESSETESEPRFTASFGVALHRHGDPLATFLSNADDALYAAKSRGRNRVVRASEVGRKSTPEAPI